MTKRKVVLISLYDQVCIGMRSIGAVAVAAGHDVSIINLKLFRHKFVSHSTPEELDNLGAAAFQPMIEVQPYDYVICPYPFEMTPTEHKLFKSKLGELNPDIIGMSLTSAFIPFARELCKEIRTYLPNIKIIVGGIHPTLDPEGCLEWADASCVGEGEGAICEYLDDPTRTDIPNIWTKEAKNPVRPLIQDIDSIPLPMYLENNYVIEDDCVTPLMELPKSILTDLPAISSTRGCPFQCTYCLHGNVRELYRAQKYVRRHSVDRFLDDLEWYKKHFPLEGGFNLWDDVFMSGKEWIDEFCEKYPKRFPNLPFAGYAHPSTCDLTMLKKLKTAGCIAVALGVQSGSDRLNRDIYRRFTKMSEFERISHEIVEAGYEQIVYDIISRCPFENEEDMMATVDLLSRMPKPTRLSLKQLVVYPFAPIGKIEGPKTTLTTHDFEFFEFLFMLTGAPGFDPKILPALARSAELRKDYKPLANLLHHLVYMDRELAKTRGEMPWGIKRAFSHLQAQIKQAVKSRL